MTFNFDIFAVIYEADMYKREEELQEWLRDVFPVLHNNIKALVQFLLEYICLNYDYFIENSNPFFSLSSVCFVNSPKSIISLVEVGYPCN